MIKIKIKNRHVSRVADAKEGALESLYEKRLRKKLENKEKDESALEVDPVDVLPVKTLDGELYYRRGNLFIQLSVLFLTLAD